MSRYHQIAFEFPERMTTEREIRVIQTLGIITHISFEENRIYIYTGEKL